MPPLRQPQSLPPPPQHRHHQTPNHHPPPSPAIFTFYTPPTTPFSSKSDSTPATPLSTKPIPSLTEFILRDSHYRTHPVVWCGAIVCLVFSLILILSGIATLIVYLAIKPKYPTFDVPSASLSAIYFDSPETLNGDFSFVANFTNPNERMDVRFEGVDLQLAFSGRPIAAGSVEQGFDLRKRGGTKVGTVRMVSSWVYLPLKVALELQQKVERNKVEYEVLGRFRVRAKVAGGIGVSYWLHSRCLLQMTSPPTGVLVSRRCTTKR